MLLLRPVSWERGWICLVMRLTLEGRRSLLVRALTFFNPVCYWGRGGGHCFLKFKILHANQNWDKLGKQKTVQYLKNITDRPPSDCRSSLAVSKGYQALGDGDMYLLASPTNGTKEAMDIACKMAGARLAIFKTQNKWAEVAKLLLNGGTYTHVGKSLSQWIGSQSYEYTRYCPHSEDLPRVPSGQHDSRPTRPRIQFSHLHDTRVVWAGERFLQSDLWLYNILVRIKINRNASPWASPFGALRTSGSASAVQRSQT